MNIALDNKWDSGMSGFSIDNLSDVDCILHGRKTAEGFIPYWTEVANNVDDSEHELGKRFSQIPNVVFSNTLTESKWNNTTILKGNIRDAIQGLKSREGKNILVYGGESFVSSLIEHDLIDEYYLLVNPAAIGNGQSTFNPLKTNVQLTLMECKPFACGAVLLSYTRQR